jgi:hypothetical protein
MPFSNSHQAFKKSEILHTLNLACYAVRVTVYREVGLFVRAARNVFLECHQKGKCREKWPPVAPNGRRSFDVEPM